MTSRQPPDRGRLYAGRADLRCALCAAATLSHSIETHLLSVAATCVDRARAVLTEALEAGADSVLVERMRFELGEASSLLGNVYDVLRTY